MAKKRSSKHSLVSEIVGSIKNTKPGQKAWYQNLRPDHLKQLDELRIAWQNKTIKDDQGNLLNPQPLKSCLARSIQSWLAKNGVRIGTQGIVAWLNR
jgi:hypothetical protein